MIYFTTKFGYIRTGEDLVRSYHLSALESVFNIQNIDRINETRNIRVSFL